MKHNTEKANMELWFSSVKIRKNVFLEVYAMLVNA